MSLNNSKCWKSNICLHFLKPAVLLLQFQKCESHQKVLYSLFLVGTLARSVRNVDRGIFSVGRCDVIIGFEAAKVD
jgi:hypothetical protein